MQRRTSRYTGLRSAWCKPQLARRALFLAVVGLLVARTPAATQSPAPEPDESSVAWVPGASLQTARDHHMVFTARGYLYAAGGTDYRSYFRDVWRARLDDDGVVVDWSAETDLPGAVAGATILSAGEHVVFTGGQQPGRSNTASTYSAPVAEDGRIGEWRPGPPLPSPVFHHAMASHGSTIYVLGGNHTGASIPVVVSSQVNDDGSLTAWRTETPLPRGRSHHAAFVARGHLCVLGGLDGNPADGPALLADVRCAPILENDSLGAWALHSLLPHPVSTHSAFAYEESVYVVGGVADAYRFTDEVWRAPISEEAKFGGWSKATSLPETRAHVHVTPVLNGNVYSVGGSNRRIPQTDVYVGVLHP